MSEKTAEGLREAMYDAPGMNLHRDGGGGYVWDETAIARAIVEYLEITEEDIAFLVKIGPVVALKGSVESNASLDRIGIALALLLEASK